MEKKTVLLLKELEYEWKILETGKIPFNLKIIKSICFGDVGCHFWCLEMKPCKDYVMTFQLIKVEEQHPAEEIYAKYTLILKRGEHELHRRHGSHIFRDGENKSRPYNFPINIFNIQENVDLKLYVILKVQDNILPMKDFVKTLDPQIQKTKGMEEFLESLSGGDFHDVVIKVDEKEIKCHKCVLSGRSSFFAPILKPSLARIKKKEVKINDFSYETINTMINFLYTFELPMLEVKSALSLLEAADKYKIPDLKEVCEKYLISKINEHNVLDILEQAKTCSAEKVERGAMDFLKNKTTINRLKRDGEVAIDEPGPSRRTRWR